MTWLCDLHPSPALAEDHRQPCDVRLRNPSLPFQLSTSLPLVIALLGTTAFREGQLPSPAFQSNLKDSLDRWFVRQL